MGWDGAVRGAGALWVLALSVLVACGGAEPRSVAPAAAEAELRELTRQRFEANAVNDRAFYERLLAPSFRLLLPQGAPPLSKVEYLDAEFPAGRLPRPKSTIRDFSVLADGMAAVVSYEVHEPYPLADGQRFEQISRRLDTYLRVEGQWRVLSMAISEPPQWPQIVQVDPRLFDEYAGTYQLDPTTSVVVTHEGGHLMAKVTGQEKVELFPESPNAFFDTTDSPQARTIFERDASGRVVAQVYRSMGQALRAEKLPSP